MTESNQRLLHGTWLRVDSGFPLNLDLSHRYGPDSHTCAWCNGACIFQLLAHVSYILEVFSSKNYRKIFLICQKK